VAIGSYFYVSHINQVKAEQQIAIKLQHDNEVVQEQARLEAESRAHLAALKEQMYEKGMAVANGQQPTETKLEGYVSQGTYSDIEGTGRRFAAGEKIKGFVIVFDNNYAYINSSILKCPWPGTVYEEGVSKSASGFHEVDPLKDSPSAYYVKAKNQLYFPYGGK
jgi:hypothetical protein